MTIWRSIYGTGPRRKLEPELEDERRAAQEVKESIPEPPPPEIEK